MWNRDKPRNGRFRLDAATVQSVKKWLEKWGLILFVSAWTFTLGVIVGRGTSPVEFDIGALERELAALKKAETAAEIQHFKIGADAVEESPELDFHEALKTTKEEPPALQPVPPVEPVVPASDAEESKDAPDAAERPAPEHIEVKKRAVPEKAVAANPAKKTDNGSATRAASEKSATPGAGDAATPPEPAEKGDAHLTIQVASFKKSEEADVKVANLKKKGYSAYKTIGKVPGKGIWFRVRVGRFASRSEAAGVMKQLEKDRQSVMLVNLD